MAALRGVVVAWAASRGGWQNAFYVPGAIAHGGGCYILWRLRDTPQSVGLPPIEEYHDVSVAPARGFPVLDPSEDRHVMPSQDALEIPILQDRERELTYRELFFDHVLTNPMIWLLAFANFFAYISRYSMLDWGPFYLREVKGASLQQGGLAILTTEFGGIPSTILLGWVSDLLKGRRGMVAVLCMIPIVLAFTVIVLTPAGFLWLDMTMLAVIGFFIYPVINLIVIMALDLTSKKAIGTAAGFIGLFGYIGRMVQAKTFGWMVDHLEKHYGKPMAWQIVLWCIIGCTILGIALLAFTWRLRPRSASHVTQS